MDKSNKLGRAFQKHDVDGYRIMRNDDSIIRDYLLENIKIDISNKDFKFSNQMFNLFEFYIISLLEDIIYNNPDNWTKINSSKDLNLQIIIDLNWGKDKRIFESFLNKKRVSSDIGTFFWNEYYGTSLISSLLKRKELIKQEFKKKWDKLYYKYESPQEWYKQGSKKYFEESFHIKAKHEHNERIGINVLDEETHW